MFKPTSVLVWATSLALLGASQEAAPATAPEFLNFDELVTLSDTDRPAGPFAREDREAIEDSVLEQ